MKIRSGFVSNSSSSSFVLSTPTGFNEVEITLKVNLGKDFWAKRFTSLHDWIKHIEKEYGDGKVFTIEEICKGDEWVKEIYFKGKNALDGGLDVIWLMLSSESENPIDRLFYEDPTALIEAIERLGCVVLTEGY